MSVPSMAAEVLAAEAVPKTTGTVPGLTANANPLNTPPSPGAISVPQSPAGTSVTNTGRTAMATRTYVGNLNPLRGWNGVRTPTNPV